MRPAVAATVGRASSFRSTRIGARGRCPAARGVARRDVFGARGVMNPCEIPAW